MRLFKGAFLALVTLSLLAACGDDSGGDECVVGTADGCEAGMICESVVGGEAPACFTPLSIHGLVFDATTDASVEGARVVALDVNGGARSSVVFTDIDGNYELPVSVERDADGNPVTDFVTIRVTASAYHPFPSAPRTALPVDLTSGALAEDESAIVVENAATSVALIPLEGDTSNLRQISGRVDHEDPGGVLVVAEQGGAAVSTSVTDRDGEFLLFNVPDGSTEVDGYRSGVAVEAQTFDVTADVADVVLSASSEGLGVVSGQANVVNPNPGGNSLTTVILVVESTFDRTLVRGEAPAGLRADMINGDFSIPDVPPGDYAVLAAFENDELVRDPDDAQGGTDIQYISVPEGGGDVVVEQSFKVTGALGTVSPGADGLEVISDPMPTLQWEDDSGDASYELIVRDAYGNEVIHETGLPSATSSPVSWAWNGPALTEGMVYQFKVISLGQNGNWLATTEDLRGVFVYEPQVAP